MELDFASLSPAPGPARLIRPHSGARFADAVSSFALVWFNVIEIG
jgi:hypothetical protein